MPNFDLATLNRDSDNLFLISDIHFGVRSDSLEWQSNITEYFHKFFIPLVKANKNKNTEIAILGDLFDNRNSINISTMNICSSVISELSEICPITILTGNHDMFKRRDSSLSSLAAVKYISNVTVISEPTVITYKNGKTILWVPYMGDNSLETEYLRQSDSDFAFLHTECIGGVMDNNTPIIDGTGIGLFKGTRVYSGHIHKRQEAENGKFVYIGSPYHLRRSDIGNTKGIYHLDLNSGAHTFHQNNVSPQYKRVPLKAVCESILIDFMEYVSNSYVDIVLSKEHSVKINVNDIIDLVRPVKLMEAGFSPYKNLLSYIMSTDINNYQVDDPDAEGIIYNSIEDRIEDYLKNVLEKNGYNGITEEVKNEILALNRQLLKNCKEA